MVSHIKLASKYKEIEEIKRKLKNSIPRDGQRETVHFSILGFLIVKNKTYQFTSLNQYNSYFKHIDAIAEKSEAYNYADFGAQAKLNQIGFDSYCKDIWRVARDPKSMHWMNFKIKDK